jgi:hypothetical protein
MLLRGSQWWLRGLDVGGTDMYAIGSHILQRPSRERHLLVCIHRACLPQVPLDIYFIALWSHVLTEDKHLLGREGCLSLLRRLILRGFTKPPHDAEDTGE